MTRETDVSDVTCKGDLRGTVNVLYVSPFSYIGGGEMSVLAVIKRLDRSRFNPSLICYGEGLFTDRARSLGIDTTVFRRNGLVTEFSVISGIVRYIKERKIGMVHVNSLDIRAGIAASVAGVPCVGHLRVIIPFTWRDALFVLLSRRTVAVSNAVAEEFCKKYPACKNRFIVIPNIVDLPSEVRPAPVRAEFGISAAAALVGMAGRMDPFKGHGIFIAAAKFIKKSLPDTKFIIIGGPSAGNGGEMAYLEAQKDEVKRSGLSDSFIFTGFREDALNAIAALDIMVVPSLVVRRGSGVSSEGFGRVAIEAMAVGVPVVSSDAGGLKEVVRDGVSGLVVPSGDPEALGKAVIQLLLDRRKAESIKNNAKEIFNSSYRKEPIDRLQGLYGQILYHNEKGGCRG